MSLAAESVRRLGGWRAGFPGASGGARKEPKTLVMLNLCRLQTESASERPAALLEPDIVEALAEPGENLTDT